MGHPEGKARPLKESLESEACPPEGFEGEARTPKKKQKKTKVAAVKARMKGKATPATLPKCPVPEYLRPNSLPCRVTLARDKKDKSFSWKMDGAKACWAE